MPAMALWLNIVLIVLVTGAIVGIPLWMVIRHPDRDPAETRRLPAYLRLRSDEMDSEPAWEGAAARDRELAGYRKR